MKILRAEAPAADLDLTEQQRLDVAEHPELEEFVRRVQAGELADSAERLRAWAEAVTAKERRDGSFKIWERLFRDGLQNIRLYATYVDVSDSGELKRDPGEIDDNFAKFMCTGAVAFLALTLLFAVQGRKCIEFRGLLKNFPDDLTGWSVLSDALVKMFPSVEPIPSLQSLAAKADAARAS